MVPSKPMCVEAFSDYAPLERFAVRDMRHRSCRCHQGRHQEGGHRWQGHQGCPEGRQEVKAIYRRVQDSLDVGQVVVPDEAKQPPVVTTCTTAKPTKQRTEESEEPRQNITTHPTPKLDITEKLVQITLSIWLLRSKLHRKEFRRKAW